MQNLQIVKNKILQFKDTDYEDDLERLIDLAEDGYIYEEDVKGRHGELATLLGHIIQFKAEILGFHFKPRDLWVIDESIILDHLKQLSDDEGVKRVLHEDFNVRFMLVDLILMDKIDSIITIDSDPEHCYEAILIYNIPKDARIDYINTLSLMIKMLPQDEYKQLMAKIKEV